MKIKLLIISCMLLALISSIFLFDNEEGNFILVKGYPNKLSMAQTNIEILDINSQGVIKKIELANKDWGAKKLLTYPSKHLVIAEKSALSKLLAKVFYKSKIFEFELSTCKNCFIVSSNLITKGDDLIYVITYTAGKENGFINEHRGFSIKTREEIDISRSDLKYIFNRGIVHKSNDYLMPIFSIGKQAVLYSNNQIKLGWDFPDFYNIGPNDSAAIIGSNDDVLVIASMKYAFDDHIKVAIYSKGNDNWVLKQFNGDMLNLRTFGSWVVSEQRYEISARAYPEKILPDDLDEKKKTELISLGYYQPGILELVNIESNKEYTIKTGVEDSEIIFVGDDTVYYRASDKLYEATLEEEGTPKTRLIIKEHFIKDVHWMLK